VATPSKQTSTLRKDEFATPNAPNKSVAGTRNIVQADIKVSFMGPQDIYESRATYSNPYPSGKDTDATYTWLAAAHDAFVQLSLDEERRNPKRVCG
jgi:hypothetical protein